MPETEVKIDLPLPMDVAATLMQIIGTAYPSAMLRTDSGRQMVLVIDDEERFKSKASKKRILAAKKCLEDEREEMLTELRNGSPGVSTPEWIAQSVGFMAERLFDEYPDAENYFEMDVRNPDTGRKFVVTVAKSERQLPTALLERAKADVARLESRIAELEGTDD